MSGGAVSAAIDFLSAWGPSIAQAGHELSDLRAFVQAHKDHPALTDEERSQAEAILAADPASL